MRTSLSSFGKTRSSRNLINIDGPHHSRTGHFQNRTVHQSLVSTLWQEHKPIGPFKRRRTFASGRICSLQTQNTNTELSAANELKGVLYLWPQCFEVSNEYLIRSWLICFCQIWILFIYFVFSDLLHAYYKPIDLEISHPAKWVQVLPSYSFVFDVPLFCSFAFFSTRWHP